MLHTGLQRLFASTLQEDGFDAYISKPSSEISWQHRRLQCHQAMSALIAGVQHG